jgi:hypothetical protein
MSDPGHSRRRRTALRAAAALVGLLAVAPLAGCTGSDPAHAVDVTPPPAPTSSPAPTPVHPTNKGDVYHRGQGDTANTNPVGTGTPRAR